MHEHREYRPVCLPRPTQFGGMENYKRADLHLHTNWTDGTLSPEKMVDFAISTGIDAIAVTDHNVITSSSIAVDYVAQKKLPIEIIPGVEVSSKDGHVLALNVVSEIEPGLSLEDTLKKIHKQNGLAIIAHPGLKIASSVSLDLLREVINSDDENLYMDGIEVFNANEARLHRISRKGVVFKSGSLKLSDFIRTNVNNPKLGALVGNTDAHTEGVGYGISVYNCESILEAITRRRTIPMVAITTLQEDIVESMRSLRSVIRSHLVGKV